MAGDKEQPAGDGAAPGAAGGAKKKKGGKARLRLRLWGAGGRKRV